MEYLTTHDLVWINTSITGTVNPYHYVTLEAAVAGQFSYGQSDDVQTQAANLLERMLSQKPYSAGNTRTAFIAVLSFLNVNGYATNVSDTEAAAIIRAVAAGAKTAGQAISELAAPAADASASSLTLRRLISHECNAHTKALSILAEGD